MKKRIVIILILCLSGASFIGCAKHNEYSPISKSQWKIFSLIPKESQAVMYINYDDVKESDFWNSHFKPYFDQSEVKAWLNKFRKRTGLKLTDYASEIISASSSNGTNFAAISFKKEIKNIHILFNDKEKFTAEVQSGKTIYQLKNWENERFIFFNDSTLAMFNDKQYANDVINNKNESLKLNFDFIDLIEKIKIKNQYWLAVNDQEITASIIKKIIGGFDKIPGHEALNSINKITLSADFNNGIKIESDLICSNSKNAYLLTAGITSAIAMGIISDKNYFLGQLTKNMKVSAGSKLVELSLQLSKNEIKELNKLSKNNNQNKNSKQL